MATTPVSLKEYLNTSYQDGDREYVDGRVVERNNGEVDHADLQRGYIHTAAGSYEPKDGILRTTEPAVELPLSEVLSSPSR